jgi:hypothetical protein
MGKYLLQILIVIHLLFLFSPNILAQEIPEIRQVEISSGGSDREILININYPNISDSKSILDVKSEYLASGFRMASDDGIEKMCQKSGTKIFCEKISGLTTYEFVWNPQKYLEEKYCKNVTAEKQKTQSLSINKFKIESESEFPYIHKIVTIGVTTDGSLSETYADLSNDLSFAVLWNVNNIKSSSSAINRISFDDLTGYEIIGNKIVGGDETYRPRMGSFQKFAISSSREQGPYEIFFANLSHNKINIDGVDLSLCNSNSVETETSKEMLRTSQIDSMATELAPTQINTVDIYFIMTKISEEYFI